MVWKQRSCPHCEGDLFWDNEDMWWQCLQCSRHVEDEEGANTALRLAEKRRRERMAWAA